ncbi:MAG: hypothetical protein WBV88_06395 [Candidatus Rickettsiella isopodorum]
MSNSDIKLNFFTKYFHIFDDQSLFICDIKSKEDRKFHFQIRFIQKNFQKINLSQLESDLKNSIVKLSVNSSLHFNHENKIKFLNALKKFGIDIKLVEIIQNNSRFKIDNQSNLIKDYNKNLITLFCIGSSKNINFGYEIPENLSENSAPLCCAQIFTGRQLSKKIYLFPISARSLDNAFSVLKNNSAIDLINLEIPYIEYLPSKSALNSNYDKEIQTRINLQTIISEILTHLDTPKCFRKNGSEKASLFRSLAKDIASDKPINTISNQLNQHDTWKLLAQHRDPWGLFSFFKGKTHSLIAWQALRDEISHFSSSFNNQFSYLA